MFELHRRTKGRPLYAVTMALLEDQGMLVRSCKCDGHGLSNLGWHIFLFDHACTIKIRECSCWSLKLSVPTVSEAFDVAIGRLEVRQNNRGALHECSRALL